MKKHNIEVWVQISLLVMIAISLFTLLTTNNIQNYVHPRLNVYLWITAFVLLVMAASLIRLALVNKHVNHFKLNALMLVVFVLITLFPTTTPITTRVETQKIATKTEVSLLETYYSSDIIKIRNEDFLKWFYDVNTHLDKYLNKKVVYNAKIHEIRGNYILATRNIMVCCAADIAAMGAEVKYSSIGDLKVGDWIQIEGIITQEYREIFKQNIPIIRSLKLEKIEPIKNEIIYP